MVTWVLYLCIGILIGGMAGFYFARLDEFSKKQKQALEDQLKKSEQESKAYRDQVSAHFKETANLVNKMTESYQKVHEHLAVGANALCNTEIEVNRLEVAPKHLSTKLPAKDGNSAPQKEIKHNQPVKQAFIPEATALTDDKEAPKTSALSNTNNKTSGVEDKSKAIKSSLSNDREESAEDTSASGNSHAAAYNHEPGHKSTGSRTSTTQTDDKLINTSSAADKNVINETALNEGMVSETSVSETSVSETVSETKSAETMVTETLVTETMAVADGFDDNNPEEKVSGKGSQMIH